MGARVEILLVEDNPGDVELTHIAIEALNLDCTIHDVVDGDAAIAFLRRQPPYEGAPRPTLVLLDLNLPKKTGHEVLAEMKADAELQRIPVVVLTTSDSASDVKRCYDAHANAYLTKPIDMRKFNASMEALVRFWFETATLPA